MALKQKMALGWSIGWRVWLMTTIANVVLGVLVFCLATFVPVMAKVNRAVIQSCSFFISILIHLIVYEESFKAGFKVKNLYAPHQFIGWAALWRVCLGMLAALIPLMILSALFIAPVMKGVPSGRIGMIFLIFSYVTMAYILVFGHVGLTVSRKWEKRETLTS